MIFNKKNILNQSFKSKNVHLLTEKERNKLKKTLLEITEDINNACDKNNIKLFLVGGSLLGAVRHKGFIPWDDDMDFGLIRKDYIKLREIFDKELGEKYYLRCPNSKYPNGNRFMQIYKKNTILETYEGNTPLQPNCISIDIFPYDYVPENKLIRTIKGLYCNMLMLIGASVCNYYYGNKEYIKLINMSISGKILSKIETVIGFVFSYKEPKVWFNKIDRAIQGRHKSNFITSATGRKHYLGEIFPVNVFFPLKKLNFENLQLYAPRNAEQYLKQLYGESYMIPPSKENQESHFIKRIELP